MSGKGVSVTASQRQRSSSLRNIRIEIEYDGANYCGWQVQNRPRPTVHGPQKRAIQEAIEKALQKILQEKIRLIGSGRTDAGVHALGQTANFKTSSSIPVGKLQRALNGLLPDDISIIKANEVSMDFHSRFDARSKVYRYTILNRNFRSAFLKGKVYFVPYPLDIRLMQRQARSLLGRHDFVSFCASRSSVRSTVRTVKRIAIRKDKEGLVTIDIEADGFLYNMVRNIAGTLIEMGRGKLSGRGVKEIFTAKDRRLAGPAAPAHGLCLLKVIY